MWKWCVARGVTSLAVLAVLAAGPGRARADFAVQELRVNTFFGAGINEVVGWEFTANATLTVTQLGWYDHGSDGLITAHSLGLFDASTMQLLVSTTIGPGTSSPLEGPPVQSAFDPFPTQGGFRYVDVSQTTLSAGGRYVIAGTDPLGVTDLITLFFPAGGPNVLVTDPNLTFVQGRNQMNSGTLVFPTDVPTFASFGPTFQFQAGSAVAVPEPGSFALLGLGAAGLLGSVQRRRRRAA
jgi:hypothetical protein